MTFRMCGEILRKCVKIETVIFMGGDSSHSAAAATNHSRFIRFSWNINISNNIKDPLITFIKWFSHFALYHVQCTPRTFNMIWEPLIYSMLDTVKCIAMNESAFYAGDSKNVYIFFCWFFQINVTLWKNVPCYGVENASFSCTI